MNVKRTGLGLIAGLILSFTSLGSYAGVPYKNQTYDFKQPNGEVLKVSLNGNDYYAEQRTSDGSLIVFDAAKHGFCYAHVNAAGDNLVSNGILASNAKLRTFSTVNKLEAGLSKEAKGKLAEQKYLQMMGHAPLAMQPQAREMNAFSPVAPSAVTGALKGLTVIIDFPNLAGTITKAQVESFLNDPNYTGFGNAQSVRGYYQSVSGNKLDYTNTVTRYYTAQHQKSYYTDNSLDASVRAQELIGEALNWLKNSEHFDFSTISTDSNKRMKGLNFFYAGESDSAWSKGLWPHMGGLGNQFCSNGVCTSRYQISNMGTQMSIGTFAHESGHLLFGWPDLYDYDGSSEGSVAGFCLMGYGAVGAQSKFKPTPPIGYFRYLAGWDIVVELNPAINRQAQTGKLSHTSGSHGLYRWSNPANNGEAFYVEAIYKNGQNTWQPDQGLAIWHVDPAGNNSDEWHPYVQMEHADGRRDPENNVNAGDATDLYDGVTTRAFNNVLPNALTSKGTNSKWWNGYPSGFGLANISVPAQTILFDVVNGDGATSGDVYQGYLADKGQAIQPSPWFQYAGGTLKINLAGPSNADFELKLEQWGANSTWVTVASSTSPTSQEAISYAAAAGYYRITVYSYSGAGNYTLNVKK
ncbi:M6 family metalloprotease-like protein [Oxalobacteraceae bacterium GrIS 1.11]